MTELVWIKGPLPKIGEKIFAGKKLLGVVKAIRRSKHTRVLVG